MENLNAETVKSELEGLVKFNTCPDYIIDALALINSQEQRINELTEENERLKNSINFQVVMPDDKMEEIKAECLERVELDVKECRADTVRKMQSEIKERCIKGGIFPAFVASTIDEIAKEMLETE